jgi:hypothetical protein
MGDFSPWDEGADNGMGVWPFGDDPDATGDDFDEPTVVVLEDEAAEVFGPPGTGKSEFFQDVINTVASVDLARPDSPVGLFQVMTGKHMPPGKAFVFPSNQGGDLLRAFRAQFPSLEAFQQAYLDYQPRAQVRVTDPTFRTDHTGQENTPTMENLAALSRNIEAMLTRFRDMAARIERFGGEPECGTVIKFEHTFTRTSVINPGGTYTYVAFRADNGAWYTTGKPKYGPISWEELLGFIGDGRAWVLAEEREVPVPNLGHLTIESADSETVGRVATELAALPEAEREAVMAEALKLARGESKED